MKCDDYQVTFKDSKFEKLLTEATKEALEDLVRKTTINYESKSPASGGYLSPAEWNEGPDNTDRYRFLTQGGYMTYDKSGDGHLKITLMQQIIRI